MKFYRICFCVVTLLLCSCSNKQNEGIKYDGSSSDDGYKPVIMYDGFLYWLSTEKPPNFLPDGFEDSQMKIATCVEDPMQLPTENLSTSSSNCSQVGISIFVDTSDSGKIITGTDNGSYQVYEKNQ